MTNNGTKLYEAHVNGDPEAYHCFAPSIGEACKHLLDHYDLGALCRQLIVWECTEAWLVLAGEAKPATAHVLRQRWEGVAIFRLDSFLEYDERWLFIGRDAEPDPANDIDEED